MTLPACCHPSENATTAEVAYCAYNAAGDPATAGLNYAGQPCPVWSELPENVRVKWNAVHDGMSSAIADAAYDLACGGPGLFQVVVVGNGGAAVAGTVTVCETP